MEFSYLSIQDLVEKVRSGMFLLERDPHHFIAPSAYDTAWLAMVADTAEPCRPMFKNCLVWVLNNQKEEGFWGDCDGHGMPSIECLPATIACMIALKKWNIGETMLNKGMAFIEANAERLLGGIFEACPRWFGIVFPGMIELARSNGLEITFPDQLMAALMDLSYKRQSILEREELVDKHHYPPLLSYFEALPLRDIDREQILVHLSDDGSLFQSPSATASAFMATGNEDCLAYLQSLVQHCENGVPPTYPMDEDLIKLCTVNQLQGLGLAEHFNQEIERVMDQVYRNYINQASWGKPRNSFATKLYKDSLAFWLLRMHGYNVSPWSFCWFLHDEEIEEYMKNDPEYFSSVMLSVYRATDLMFPGEVELEKARTFSRMLLERAVSTSNSEERINVPFPNLHNEIGHKLKFQWMSRLDHLEHRMFIEGKNANALWQGKSSFHRLSSLYDDKLMRLAKESYELRQSIYKHELEELKKWSRSCGLADMGFGREKTTYCYFAVAASTSLPLDSDIRMVVAKSAIIITVADDFYDMEGSLDELENLTDAVRRWDARGLSGHGKTIFDVLDNLVGEMAAKHLEQQGRNIRTCLQQIWYETFASWFQEAKWSRSGGLPSTQEYLETGVTSIATHTIVLPASCLLNPSLPSNKLKAVEYESITKLLMVIPRLLNDIQSYEKEEKEGKINYVLLYMKENPEADIEDSIAYVRQMLKDMKQELLEHALMDGLDDLSKPCRDLHLSCLKVFQMFFDSTNRYDSETEMLQDIQKAIYVPLQVGPPKPFKIPLPSHDSGSPTKKYQTVARYSFGEKFKHYRISHATIRLPCQISMDRHRSLPTSTFKLCFS